MPGSAPIAAAPPSHRFEGEKPPKAVNPHQAYQWRLLSLRDEHGRLEPGAYQRALAQRTANLEASMREGPGGISPFTWTERGPSNVAGRTRSLLIDPVDPTRMWAGSVGGGLWFSADAGATWSPVDDRFDTLAIGCLAMDPTDRSTIYLGTGEGFFNGDAIGGTGIYKSEDGGVTWSLLSATAGFGSVNRIAVCPVNPSVVLAGTTYGGVRRSTDAGQTWSTVRGAQSCLDVDFEPNSGAAVAHVMDWNGSDWVHGVAYSTNRGATWANATGAFNLTGFGSRIEVQHAPSSPNIVYATTGKDGGKVYRSEDHGHTFTLRTQAGQSTGSSWYANPLWVHPTNPDVILSGGVHIVRSIDGGQTFTQISGGYILTQQPHPDIHNFTTHPGFNGTTDKRVYVVTDGGAFLANDIMTASTSGGWSFIGLGNRTTQFYGAVGHGPTDTVVGGTQDNGTLRVVGTGLGHLTFGGDGGFCAIDPGNPNYVFGEYINLKIHRSSDAGTSASYIYAGLTDAEESRANFIAPFILDPNTRHLLAGGRSLWRCANPRSFSPPTWTAIMPDRGTNISAIATAPGNGDIIWVGLNDGRVYRTANGRSAAPAWITVDDNVGFNPIPNRYVTRIAIDPVNHSRAYVALGGFSPDNVLRTDNDGATFVDVTGSGATGLPDAPVRGLALHPQRAGWLYAGTEVGLFASQDGGQTWATSNQGPTTASVDEVNFMNGSTVLVAATHGRGMWTTPTDLCPGDLSTTADPDAPGYGEPDGRVDSSDFFYFLDRFVAGDTLVADLTGSSDPLDPGYGVADGLVDAADFFYYLDLFVQPCP